MSVTDPPLADDATCIRCGHEFESLEHRLWHCPANAQRLATLKASVSPAVRILIPEGLPNCLRRCALIPKHFIGNDYEIESIQEFLVRSASDAAKALGESKPAADAS